MTALPELIACQRRVWLLLAMLLGAVTSCTGHIFPKSTEKDVIFGPGFAIVTAEAGDTFSGLARSYLIDQQMAWTIAAFNRLEAPETGRPLVIPLQPVNLGGLTPEGYQTVPIFHYPRIENDPREPTVLSAAAFAEQMQWLETNGFSTVSLDQLWGFLQFAIQLPPKSVVLSFDSGQRWIHEIAVPILQRHGFTAALFISTQSIGQTDSMTWDELTALAQSGFDIGTSGRAGLSLFDKPESRKTDEWLNAIEAEIVGAAETITARLGIPCRYFAYPNGDDNDLLVALLNRHGYLAAFTRKPGTNAFFADNYRLSRITIEGDGHWTRFKGGLTVFQTADLR